MINWEERYSKEGDVEQYDWYISGSKLAPLLVPLTLPDDEILYVGCGKSDLGAELSKRKRKFVTNIDSSKRVIRTMSNIYSEFEDMQFVEMDVLKMPQDLDQAFQLVIDKALLDYFLCEVNVDKAMKYLTEIKRVIKPGGHFCVVSHGIPENRVPLLVSAFSLPNSTRIKISKLPKPEVEEDIPIGADSYYFLYTVRAG